MDEQRFDKLTEFMGRERDAFLTRERERDIARAELNRIAECIAEAETRLRPLGIFGSEERLRLARARVETLRALHHIDVVAADVSEERNRVFEAVTGRD